MCESGFFSRFGLAAMLPLMFLISCAHIERSAKTPELDKSRLSLFNKILDIEEEIYGEVDRERAHRLLSEILVDLNYRLRTARTPRQKIERIAKYLFVDRNIKSFDPSPYSLWSWDLKKANSVSNEVSTQFNFITSVLTQRKGMCVTLVELYLIIGEYFDLPFYFAVAPDHVFIQYDDGQHQYNIETTNGGDIKTDDYFLDYYGEDEDTLRQSGNLETHKQPNQILGAIYYNLIPYFIINKKNLGLAKHMLQNAIDLKYEDVSLRISHATILALEGEYERSINVLKALLTTYPNNTYILSGLGVSYFAQEKLLLALNMFKRSFENGLEKASDAANMTYSLVKPRISLSEKEVISFSGKVTYEFKLDPKWFRLKNSDQLKIYLGDNNHTYIKVTYISGSTESERTAILETKLREDESQEWIDNHPICSVLIREKDETTPYFSCHLFRKNEHELLNFALVVREKKFERYLPTLTHFVDATEAY